MAHVVQQTVRITMERTLSVAEIVIYVIKEVSVISVDRHLHERIHGLVCERMDEQMQVVVQMKIDVVIRILIRVHMIMNKQLTNNVMMEI